MTNCTDCYAAQSRAKLGVDSMGIARIAMLVAVFFLGVGFFGSANAQKNAFILTCQSCGTTSDFVSAARSQAAANVATGVYIGVSSSNPETAYIAVNGTIRCRTGITLPCPLVLVNITTTPVDVSGNSLASLSESQLEQTYTSFDVALFGTERNNPLWITPQLPGFNLPDAPSFIGSTDANINLDISLNGPLSEAIASLGVGEQFTIKFADNTTAQFQVDTISTINGHTIVSFHWTGIAHDAHGNPIDRSGRIQQQGMAGNVGGGGRFMGGGGGGYQWNLGGDPGQCSTSTTITINGEVDSTYFGFVPCF